MTLAQCRGNEPATIWFRRIYRKVPAAWARSGTLKAKTGEAQSRFATNAMNSQMRFRQEDISEDMCGDMSFVIHLWLEHDERRAWRGRVTHDDGSHFWFEDGHSLLGFIRDRLQHVSKVKLPMRASRP